MSELRAEIERLMRHHPEAPGEGLRLALTERTCRRCTWFRGDGNGGPADCHHEDGMHLCSPADFCSRWERDG